VSGGMKMIVYHPVSYEDTQNIIDNIKNRKPVIVNMEELEIECAQRILDFLSGAVYALNGTMSKISRGIFVVAPNNYDVVGNGEDEYDM
ncbi:MAG TPA: cell division protein SepF, partial [Candidatus Aphodomorpha intestinavium]|nr:cell division protein SepF [Candidatus Aphodomorpha intestinavium]